ncbi:hypothetical protein B0H13DRAFT_1895563 [Mycena leptocephala]|nr:hypothetical protein B0H13DRAFT_1895563 [Mycena leptocephala]
MSPPYPGVLLCEPTFVLDPHNENVAGYFAVISESWKGIVTSERHLMEMLNKHAPARTFKADTKLRIMELWVQDCTEYHNHEGNPLLQCPTRPRPRPFGFLQPTVVPTPSPFSATDSSDSCAPSPTPTPCPSPTKVDLRGQQNPGAKLPSLTTDELAYLANFRPPPGVLSPQRTRQLFARVLGPDALIRGDAARAAIAPEAIVLALAPMLYAVGGHKRIFLDRQKALELFRRTPGAELAFSRDAAEIWTFLDENSTQRRVLPQGTQAMPKMYAVSGHKHVFQDSDCAVALLRSTSGGELSYGYNENEIWTFLAAAGLTT